MEEHIHEHTHEHSHSHTHDPVETKKIQNRLNKIIGHLKGISRMVEDNRDCTEILHQIAAVQAALTSTSKVILSEHMKHCITDAVNSGDVVAIAELEEIINKFMK